MQFVSSSFKIQIGRIQRFPHLIDWPCPDVELPHGPADLIGGILLAPSGGEGRQPLAHDLGGQEVCGACQGRLSLQLGIHGQVEAARVEQVQEGRLGVVAGGKPEKGTEM